MEKSRANLYWHEIHDEWICLATVQVEFRPVHHLWKKMDGNSLEPCSQGEEMGINNAITCLRASLIDLGAEGFSVLSDCW